MMPNILEYEDGRVKVTAQAYSIPEIKALIDKYDMDVEPYLSYVHAMSAPDSAYIRVPIDERSEAAIYDIQDTLGEFDFGDPLVKIAIEKLQSLYASPIVLLAAELEEEINRWRKYLRDTPLDDGSGMNDGNIKVRMAIVANIDKYAKNVAAVRKQADEEIKARMKGNAEMGEY